MTVYTPSGGGAVAPLTLTAPTPTTVPLTIHGAAGQSADLLDLSDPAGAQLSITAATAEGGGSGAQFVSNGGYQFVINGAANGLLIRGAAGGNQVIVAGSGGLQISTRPAFVASDHYLVCDSNGNVHVSATGPAS